MLVCPPPTSAAPAVADETALHSAFTTPLHHKHKKHEFQAPSFLGAPLALQDPLGLSHELARYSGAVKA